MVWFWLVVLSASLLAGREAGSEPWWKIPLIFVFVNKNFNLELLWFPRTPPPPHGSKLPWFLISLASTLLLKPSLVIMIKIRLFGFKEQKTGTTKELFGTVFICMAFQFILRNKLHLALFTFMGQVIFAVFWFKMPVKIKLRMKQRITESTNNKVVVINISIKSMSHGNVPWHVLLELEKTSFSDSYINTKIT